MATNFVTWRIKFEGSFGGTSAHTRFAEVAVRSVVGGPNLAMTNLRGDKFSTSYNFAHAIDGNPTTFFATDNVPKSNFYFDLPSAQDLVEIMFQAPPANQLVNYAPKKFSLWGAWVDGTWIKVADFEDQTTVWTAGEIRTYAIPPYSFPKNMEFIGRTLATMATDSTGDDQITVSKSVGFAVADMSTYSLSKAMTYALTDNLTNGLAKALVYAVVEEAREPGQVDGFRMRNAVGRNIVMRGGKGDLPPLPPIHYPPGQIPLEPQ